MSVGFEFESKKKIFNIINETKFDEVLKELAKSYFFIVNKYEKNTYVLDFSYSGLLHVNLLNGCIKGDFLNNIGGPGVHKEVISFLDDLSKLLKVEIVVEDETDYWNHRNFYLLKEAYIDYLRGVMNLLYEKGSQQDKIHFLLCWPFHWSPNDVNGFISQVGTFSLDDIKRLINKNNYLGFAEIFFIWFNDIKDDLYHKQLALYLMWCECFWVKPRNKEEENVIKLILNHVEKAKQMNPNIELPLDAIKAIELLSENITEINYTGEIGYRRQSVLIHFPGSWDAIIPGIFLESNQDDDHVFWVEDRNFRLTPYTLNTDYNSRIISQNQEKIVNEQVDGIKYIAKITKEDGYWFLQGEVFFKNNLAIVTITFSDLKYKEWAIETFKKVKYNGKTAL